ncbi:MAG: hypothetical protein M0P57_08670 [Syntrophales bacterium]|jgi:small-conductance mechanosensitive channel|nr:hypothetical protein [Syntrophales bacterium]MDY0044139.1 hypothetical protein [Syntrophales bacterium]
MEITAAVTGAWDAFATKITLFIPKLLGAVIIFLAGWLIAKIVAAIVIKLLRAIRFDKVAERGGVDAFLEKGNILKTPSEILSALTYWFIMILVIMASLDALGLPIASQLLNSIFLYIPNVIAAVIVLILGILFGNLVSAVVRTAASNAGIRNAEGLEKFSFYAIAFFAVIVAFYQLGIGEEIFVSLFILSFGAVALAFGLAFGIGGRDVAGDYLKKWFGKKQVP